jgi:hypothetical protein
VSATLDRFVAAGPPLQREATRALLALARRPRGRALLRRLGPLDQAAGALLAMDHFDEPEHSVPLGWDPAAVLARGREVRR